MKHYVTSTEITSFRRTPTHGGRERGMCKALYRCEEVERLSKKKWIFSLTNDEGVAVAVVAIRI
jgi:hypothetical protein